jgi:glycosyltransferase involved in cell wall biosynthesis
MTVAESKSSKSVKRVLLIAPQPFFMNRGTPINVRAMVESLSERGYLIDLLVYPFGEEVEIDKVTIIRSPRFPMISFVPIGPSWQKLLLDALLVPKAIQLVLTKRYSVIHGVEEAGCVAGILAILKRVPYIFDMDSCVPDQLRQSGFITSPLLLSFVERIETFFIRRATAVLTVCSSLSRKVRQIAPGVPVAQIEDFPYDTAMQVDERLVGRLREELAVGPRKVALYTGNLEPYQGIDLLIEAFALAIKRFDERHIPLLLLVGGGSTEDELVVRYRRKAEALGIAPFVVLTGSRPASEMGSFMELADVLLSPRSEGSNTPLKVYSYMAAEKPIVATRIESHTQVLDDSTAYLAEPNPESYSGQLVDALEQSEVGQQRRISRARAAKELIDTRYNRQEFSRRLLELYENVAGAPSVELKSSAVAAALTTASK